MLTVRHLTKSYRSAQEQVAVLRGVDLDVGAGESVALTGESGSGKSTLLHLIAGLDDVDGGEIRLNDAVITGLPDAARAALRRDRLGLVFQQFNLIPSLTVADNLAFQARIAGKHEAAWQGELTERLGLGALL
jgi:putative ABC transport system ATP-binding protein